MKRTIASAALLGVFATIAIACALETNQDVDQVSTREDPVTAVGTVPAGLPSKVMVGLFEDKGATWMQNSGVPWDARYAYFTKGWVNNWGFSPADGSWGLSYFQECAAHSYLPTVQYYQMNGEAGGGEAQFLAKAQNATTMKGYFSDFKTLMTQVKNFGKPVLILLEADGFGFLEQQAGGNPSTSAAVASTGMAELAGLPNTVAGWGLAFLQIRKSVGATNAILGIHISAWASGQDVAYSGAAVPIQPEIDKVYSFLAPFGLASNVTGQTYDVLVGDPLDRDSDYYKLTQNQNRWWDASDAASLSSMSFNHYAEWLRLWNVKASKRWVLWQIPLGNSNQLDVANTGSPRQGYKDNRPEYFFSSGTAHAAKFAADGVVALLFGRGQGDQSNYTNDQFTDGKLFMQSRVASFYQAGGVPLGGSSPMDAGVDATADSGHASDSGVSDSGVSDSGVSDAGMSDGGMDAGSSDGSKYSFESGVQGWTTSGGMITGVASSTSQAFAGTHALQVTFNGAAGSQMAFVSAPAAVGGQVVSFHVWVPAGSAITSVQPYVQQGAAGSWTFTGNWQPIGGLKAGGWTTLNVTVPAGAVTPLFQLGVQFTTSATWSGTAYVDAVTW